MDVKEIRNEGLQRLGGTQSRGGGGGHQGPSELVLGWWTHVLALVLTASQQLVNQT